MKNTLIVGGMVVVLALGYAYVSSKKSNLKAVPSPVPSAIVAATPSTDENVGETNINPALVVGIFRGLLPCADCPGIDTTLTLIREDADAAEGTYSMTSVYQEKNVQPYNENGKWTTLRGTKTSPNATVYQLQADGATGYQYFLRVNDDELTMLDSDQKEITSTMNYTLRRIGE